MRNNQNLRDGLNMHKGKVTYKAVHDYLGEQLGLDYVDPLTALDL